MQFYLWLKKQAVTAREFVTSYKLLISIFSVASLIAIGVVLGVVADTIAVLQAGGLAALLTVPLAGVGFTLIAKQFRPETPEKSKREITVGVVLVVVACIILIPTFVRAARSTDSAPVTPTPSALPAASTTSSTPAKADDLHIEFHARTGGGEWEEEITPLPSTPFQMRATFTNTSSFTMRDVRVRVSLPPELQYVHGSSFILNTNNSPNGAQVSDDIVGPGQNIGHYTPQSNALLIWSAIPTSSGNLPCIPRTFSPLLHCTVIDETRNAELTVKIRRPNC